jgi:hypothetical protein
MAGRYQGFHLFGDETARATLALRSSGSTTAGFGDRVLKDVRLTIKGLGRSQLAARHLRTRRLSCAPELGTTE